MTQPYTLDIYIPGLPKIFSNGPHGQWRGQWAAKRKWTNLVILAVGHKKPPKPLTKAKVILTRYSSVRPDKDNRIISFKPILDGLKKAGVIIDDNDDVVDTIYPHVKVGPRDGKIRIQVESMEHVKIYANDELPVGKELK